MRINVALARRVALILGLSFPAFSNALADGRAVLPPRWMVEAYLSDAVVKPSRDDIARAIIPGLGFVPAFLGGGLGTTWSASVSTNHTLSNGDLTGVSSGNAFVSHLRGSTYKSSGKWYFEVSIVAISSGETKIGIASAAASTSSLNLGESGTESAAYSAYNGSVRRNNNTISSGATYAAGDVIGVMADVSNHRVYFHKNGVWHGGLDPSNLLNNGYDYITTSPVTIAAQEGIGSSVTLNAGATAFAYSIPTGALSWGQ